MSTWLSRALWYGPLFTLCTSQEAFEKALTDIELPRDKWEPWLVDGSFGSTHTYEHHSGDIACIVCVKPTPNIVDRAAILAHEATHIWQRYCRHIGETTPGNESEAYAIQHIVWHLMESYRIQMKGKR